MSEPCRQYHVTVDAGDGESYRLTDEMLRGTCEGLRDSVERLVDAWEGQTGLEALTITLESHGKWLPNDLRVHVSHD